MVRYHDSRRRRSMLMPLADVCATPCRHQSLPNQEDAEPLRAIFAHDSLVHPDNPLHEEGVDGIRMYMGQFSLVCPWSPLASFIDLTFPHQYRHLNQWRVSTAFLLSSGRIREILASCYGPYEDSDTLALLGLSLYCLRLAYCLSGLFQGRRCSPGWIEGRCFACR